MGEHEFRLQRNLAMSALKKSASKLREAIDADNERRVSKLLRDLKDNKTVTMERHLQLLAKTKTSLDDPAEADFMNSVDTFFDDINEEAEIYLEVRQVENEKNEQKRKLIQRKNIAITELESEFTLMCQELSEHFDQVNGDSFTEDDSVFVLAELQKTELKSDQVIAKFNERIESITDADNVNELAVAKSRQIQMFTKKISDLRKSLTKKGYTPLPSLNGSVINPRHSPGSSGGSGNQSYLRSKKLEPPKFNGNLRSYTTFKRAFKDIVIESECYNERQMAHILRSECLTGEPKNLCENILDYQQLWAKLDEVYQDEPRVVHLVLDDISNFKKIGEKDYDQFIKYVDMVEKAFLDLSAMGNANVLDHPQTVRTIETRCPEWFQLSLNERRDGSESPDKERFPFLFDFLKLKRKGVRKIASMREEEKKKVPEVKSKKASVNAVQSKPVSKPKESTTSSSSFQCIVPGCKYTRKHFLSECNVWKGMDGTQKGKVVLDNKLCVLCFSKQHDVSACPRKGNWKACDIDGCNQWHSRKLHGAKVPGLTLAMTAATDLKEESVILLMQQAQLRAGDPCQVFWDSGSTTALVTNSFAAKANLTGTQCVLKLTTVHGELKEIDSCLYCVPLQDSDGNIHHIWAYGIDKITGDISSPSDVDLQEFFPQSDVQKITLPSGSVDLLVGINYPNLFPVQIASKGNLALYKSMFGSGFLVGGNVADRIPDPAKCHHAAIVAHGIAKSLVPDFLSAESLGVELPRRCRACQGCKECTYKATHLSWQENAELRVIEEGLSLDPVDKKWTSSYPYKKDPAVLPDNYNQAVGIMKSLERRLTKNNRLEEFNEEFSKTVERGVFVEVDCNENYSGPVHYISLVDAYKEGPHSTTPLRICANSSLKSDGISLNDILCKGPPALNELWGVLIRFRSFKVAFTKDLSKFYQSIDTKERDKHLRRIVWRFGKEDENPKIFMTCTVNFGDKPAGCISQVALRNTAQLYKEIDPVAASMIIDATYVDDTNGGADTREAAEKISQSMDDIVELGGFVYKKTVMSGDKLPSSDDFKVLGVGWDTEIDSLYVSTKVNFGEKKKGLPTSPDADLEDLSKSTPDIITKRMVWRVVLAQYDALGLVSIFMVRLKLMMKFLTSEAATTLGWDDPIPDEAKYRFLNLIEMLGDIAKLRFPRSLVPESISASTSSPSLLTLVDGSKLASCALVYIRWELPDGSFACRLVTGKTKIAPTRKISIPRMELVAAVLGVRLACKVLEFLDYQFESNHFFTDSTAVLGMLRGDCSTFQEFVGTRVSEVRSKSDTATEWSWIPTDKNLADLGTRETVTPDMMNSSSSYQNGMEWMKTPMSQWPTLEVSCDAPEEEKLKAAQSFFLLKEQPVIFDCAKFSSFQKVVRITMFIVKFIIKVSKKLPASSIWAGRLKTADNLMIKTEVENYWFHHSQHGLAQKLKKGDYISLRPQFKKVFVFNNEVEIAVISGRLQGVLSVGYDKSELPLLESTSPLSKLIINDSHNESHCNIERTLLISRRTAWITKAKNLSRNIVFNCFQCKLSRKKTSGQIMAPIPEERIPPSPPFYNIAIDLFGPYQIKDSVKNRVKRDVYGIMICCLVTSAVHLESMDDYSTDSALLALRRFFNIRGTPKYIQSDPGTQLKAAGKSVQMWDCNHIRQFADRKNISWKVIPTGSQHCNGMAESLIKSAKKQLTFLLKTVVLTKSELDTLLSDVMNILNSRPLTIKASQETDNFISVTPNHLLLGRSTPEIPVLVQESTKLTKRLTFLEDLKTQFWDKWFPEAFQKLLPSPKWNHECRNVQVGDIVLMKNESKVTKSYHLGKVKSVMPSQDGKVRSVIVQYKNVDASSNLKNTTFQETERSVHNLVVIVPIDWSSEKIENELLPNLKI